MNGIYKAKYLLALSMLCMLFSTLQASMPPQGLNLLDPRALAAFEAMTRAAEEAAREAARIARQKAEAKERQIRELERQRREAIDNGRPEEARLIQERITAEQRAALAAEERWDKVGAGLANVLPQAFGTVLDIAKAEANAKNELEREAVRADANKKAAIAQTQEYIKAMTDPKNVKLGVLGLSAAALGVCVAWQGTKLLSDAVKHWYRNPSLAQETSLLSLSQKLSRFFMGIKPEETKVSDVVLEPALAERIAVLAETVKNTVKNGAYFSNILFYGPPGTGKTMLAQRIARNSGLEYIYFAASSLEGFSVEEAIIKLTELFEFGKRSSKKIMIIIDEAEKLLGDRSKPMSDKTAKMLTHILTYTGTESRDFMLVVLTNRPEDLDGAVLSRCDHKIEISAPGAEQRKQIVDLYIKKYLINAAKAPQQTGSFLSRLFYSAAKPKQLTIKPEVITPENINAIASRLNNFVGRDISKLVLAIQSTAYASKDAIITKEMVDAIVEIKVQEKQRELAGFVKVTKKS